MILAIVAMLAGLYHVMLGMSMIELMDGTTGDSLAAMGIHNFLHGHEKKGKNGNKKSRKKKAS